MIEALRGLGYSPQTAIADILDNSISAGASQAHVHFDWNGEASTVVIADDGCGMSPGELEAAMRLGDRNPRDHRAAGDLGRFGLGLKTASFSQCRRLTVASKLDGMVSCLRWDLDILASDPDGAWRLLEGTHPGAAHLLAPLDDLPHGTCVIWEVPDRIVGPGFGERDFLDMIDVVEGHLAMVFHRYLSGTPRPFRILLNGRPVRPWDPFMTDHPATQAMPVYRLQGGRGTIEAKGYVLPHRDKLSPREYERGGGPAGWAGQQGFYVHRDHRLLVPGSWLGLGHGKAWTKEEPFRLARISLDITNADDADWRIDVRKSTARPPAIFRDLLRRVAEDTRRRAQRVFAFRGAPAGRPGQDPVTPVWTGVSTGEGVRYRVDRAHPAVRSVLEEAGPLLPSINAMLRIIEETVPVQRIWLDTAEEKEAPKTGFSGEPPSEVVRTITTLYRVFVRRNGLSSEDAKRRLLRTDPFQNFPELVAALPDEPE